MRNTNFFSNLSRGLTVISQLLHSRDQLLFFFITRDLEMLAFGCGSSKSELQQTVAFLDVAEQNVVGADAGDSLTHFLDFSICFTILMA